MQKAPQIIACICASIQYARKQGEMGGNKSISEGIATCGHKYVHRNIHVFFALSNSALMFNVVSKIGLE